MAFLDLSGLQHFLEKLDARFLGISATAANASKVNNHTVNADVPSGAKFTDTTYTSMKGATTDAAGASGLVPGPTAGAATRYLRSDGTWAVPPDTNTTYSAMGAASSSAAGKAGLVPAPAAGKQTSFLRGDGTWVVPTNTTYSSLKNPYAISFTGGATGSYDGSSAVSIAIPAKVTKTSELTNDSGFLTSHQSLADYAKKTDIASVYKYKGSVDTYSALPTSGQTTGDVYNVVAADTTNNIKAGDNVCWNGSAWDNLSGVVDLSAYATKSSLATVATSGKYSDLSGKPTIPTTLKNPNKLTFTGGSTATYDGSAAVSVAIPTALKNPNTLTFTGGATGSYDGSAAASIAIPSYAKGVYNTLGLVKPSKSYAKAATLTTTAAADSSATPTINAITTTAGKYYAVEMDVNGVPFVNVPWANTTYSSLKNPNSLTFTGAATGSYDGSAAKTVNIPSYAKGVYNALGLIKPSKSYTKAATLTTTAASDSSAQPTINAITTTTGRYYAVEMDVNGVPFVNVPWTDNNTTYAAITTAEIDGLF